MYDGNQPSMKQLVWKLRATKSRSVYPQYSTSGGRWTFSEGYMSPEFLKSESTSDPDSVRIWSVRTAPTLRTVYWERQWEYIQLIIQGIEPNGFRTSGEEQATQYSQNCKLLKETREQEALMSQKNSKDHKIWVDSGWTNRLLQAMVDSEATDNYILQQDKNARTNTAERWSLCSIYGQRRIWWITDQVHIKAIILEITRVDLMFSIQSSMTPY
jgi:hypothetical protein